MGASGRVCDRAAMDQRRSSPSDTPPGDGIGGGPLTAAEEERMGVDETAGTTSEDTPALASTGPWIAVALVLLAIFVGLVVIGLLPDLG